MKTGFLPLLLLSGSLVAFGASSLAVQTAAPSTSNGTQAPPGEKTPPAAGRTGGPADLSKVKQMVDSLNRSPGLAEVVKLTQAGVDEAVIVSFVQSSTVAYRPSAEEVLQLRESGVSSAVITAVLQRGTELRQRAADAAAAAPAPAAAPAVAAQPSVPEPVAVQPTPVYYPAPVVYPVVSPTIVYSSYGYGGYGYGYGGCYYPRWSPGWGCYGGFGPRISVGVGLGFGGGHGHWASGGFRGGFRGGFHHR